MSFPFYAAILTINNDQFVRIELCKLEGREATALEVRKDALHRLNLVANGHGWLSDVTPPSEAEFAAWKLAIEELTPVQLECLLLERGEEGRALRKKYTPFFEKPIPQKEVNRIQTAVDRATR